MMAVGRRVASMIRPCCGPSGLAIVAPGASWAVAFLTGGLIQTAFGRSAGCGQPLTKRSGCRA